MKPSVIRQRETKDPKTRRKGLIHVPRRGRGYSCGFEPLAVATASFAYYVPCVESLPSCMSSQTINVQHLTAVYIWFACEMYKGTAVQNKKTSRGQTTSSYDNPDRSDCFFFLSEKRKITDSSDIPLIKLAIFRWTLIILATSPQSPIPNNC